MTIDVEFCFKLDPMLDDVRAGQEHFDLAFIPRDRHPTHFDVTVTNTSERALPFQVELSLPGFDPVETKWYRVEPHIISQRVGGQLINFRVAVLEVPRSTYGKLVTLLVKVISPELDQVIETQELRLKVFDYQDSDRINSRIHLKDFRKELTLIPDHDTNPDGELDLVVTNHSDRFTSFKLELLPFDTDLQSDTKWYTVEPQVSTKKPPGESTQFHLKIIKEPIPIYDSTLNLVLKVFSVEDENLFMEKPLKLTIKSPAKPIRLSLPTENLKVLPGNTIDIPVLIHSVSSRRNQVTLTLTTRSSTTALEDLPRSPSPALSDLLPQEHESPSTIPLNWFQQPQHSLVLSAGSSQQVIFQCCPPAEPRTIRKIYPFIIEARSSANPSVTRVEGKLEILPWGDVVMNCLHPQVAIPPREPDADAYIIEFLNQSNTPQTVCLQRSEHQTSDGIRLMATDALHQFQDGLSQPEMIQVTATTPQMGLEPAQVGQVILKPIANRPLLGWKRQRFLAFTPTLLPAEEFGTSEHSPDSSIELKPHQQILELIIHPLIPPLLQLGGALLFVLLLWLVWFLNPRSYHDGTINFVRLIGNGGTVVSGSSDQTIRRWQVNRSRWMPDVRRLKYEGVVTDRVGKAVRVMRQIPEHEQHIAVGLENGEIQLWDVSLGQRLRNLRLNGNDRVFDLDFTTDSRYLLSGHGSGIARLWDLDDPNDAAPMAQAYPKFAIFALAIQESAQPPQTNPSPLAVMAGQYNRLVLWDWQQRQLYEVAYTHPAAAQFDAVAGQYDYMTSIDISDDQKWLVTADNQGYILLWDLPQLRQCMLSTQLQPPPAVRTDGMGNAITSISCNDSVIAWWRAESHPQPIRSVALSQRGCHLASVGDDGRVLLWHLNSEAYANQQLGQPTTVAEFANTQLNSVDITATRDHVLIASDASRDRVWLLQRKRTNHHADCQ
jgi:WD40 repeat protein